MAASITADVAIVGLGAIGSAVALALARRSVRVIGLEAGPQAHSAGSSHGDTRLLRLALPACHQRRLVVAARALWWRLERESGQWLFDPVGQTLVGDGRSPLIVGALRPNRDGGSMVQTLGASDLRALGLVAPEVSTALFDPSGGALFAEQCVKAQCSVAIRLGARLEFQTPVTGVARNGVTFDLKTEHHTISAAKVVFCCAAWSAARFPGLRLRVHRVPQVWFRRAGMHPCGSFVYDLPQGDFYGAGFGGDSVKVGGPRHDLLQDPSRRGDHPPASVVGGVRDFVGRYVPSLASTVVRAGWCMSTATPDEEFIVDQRPDGTVIACGFSGRGFKYAPALGELTADIVCGEQISGFAEFHAERIDGVSRRIDSVPSSSSYGESVASTLRFRHET